MICGSCGESIYSTTSTNQCPKCCAVICPECGCGSLDPVPVMPKNENDTVGVVFGFKPYWKCRKCGTEFKDSMLIQAENEQSNLSKQAKQDSSDIAIGMVFLGLILLVMLMLVILMSNNYFN